ncbi:MAG: DNA-directed RNA polymerase subunit P [Candidatus Aenigmarchaeota archaeon]|nr:DNA-directed RNA polymerase subunit P [Candidatus Aenigmarchaeota archaeon]
MVVYVCVNCGKEFELQDKVQCPFCGSRIVRKKEREGTKEFIAR